MASLADLTRLKMTIFEDTCPMFSEEELRFLLSESDSFDEAVYKALLAKAYQGNFEIQGLSVTETSDMFLRLANEYKPSNSRLLR